MELKFFHLVEINLEHPALSSSSAIKEFTGLSWLTLTSLPYSSDSECVDVCMDFMQHKLKEFEDDGYKPKLFYSENPLIDHEPTEEDIDAFLEEECSFDDNTLIYTALEDATDWMVRGSVMVYGVDHSLGRYN
jgi:hypothetical protein